MSTWKEGQKDSSQGKGPSNNHKSWQERERYNGGYSQQQRRK